MWGFRIFSSSAKQLWYNHWEGEQWVDPKLEDKYKVRKIGQGIWERLQESEGSDDLS